MFVYLCTAMKLNKFLFQRRCELLANASDAEKAAFDNLQKLGYADTVRQFPIQTGRRTYFADLFIPSLRCIVEVDGGYHTTQQQKRKDTNRSQGIWRLGLHVMRLSNSDARSIDAIRAKLKRLQR